MALGFGGCWFDEVVGLGLCVDVVCGGFLIVFGSVGDFGVLVVFDLVFW